MTQDLDQAAFWLDRAAQGGVSQAAFNVGLMYVDGWAGRAADPVAARLAFERALAQNNEPAAAMLGWIWQTGAGVPADPERALALYRRGQAAGDAMAFEYEARMHLAGDGVPHDPARARALFGEAAGLGLAASLSSLGWMVVEGHGGPAEPERGEALLRQALAEGEGYAGRVLAVALARRNEPAAWAEAAALCDAAAAQGLQITGDDQFPACASAAKHVRAG